MVARIDTRGGRDQLSASMGAAYNSATSTTNHSSSVAEPANTATAISSAATTNHTSSFTNNSATGTAANHTSLVTDPPAEHTSPAHSASTDHHSSVNSAASTEHTISVSLLEGFLLKSHTFFPYYMLLALEAGGPMRALILLLVSPLIWTLSMLGSEALSIHIMIFISVAGLKLSEVCEVAKAVLPKFFMDDMNRHADACRVFLCSRHKCVLTSHPRVMVDYFLSSHLDVEKVVGTELHTTKTGYCTGIVGRTGVLGDKAKLDAAKEFFGDTPPDVGSGSKLTKPFLSFGREGLMISHADKLTVGHRPVKEPSLNPLVFHDGRFILQPTPFACIAMCLWAPFGMILGIFRLLAGSTLPREIFYPIMALLGIKLRVGGAPPLDDKGAADPGILYACTHRTPADPLFVSAALGRHVLALTYSLSRLTEIVSPVPTMRLTRNRQKDAEIIRSNLKEDDLIVCPEGTTCREPFLLRFSSLFADVAERVVPVALNVHLRFFHATSARGYKSMDPVFLLLNPQLAYDVRFLEPLQMSKLHAEGKSSIEIANCVQKQLADALGFQCTMFTRRDKYTYLAGTDGTVKP